jgi:TPR repeat protein
MNKLYDRRPYQPYDDDENDFIDTENEFDDNESIYSMSDVYMSDSDDEFENDTKYEQYEQKSIDSKFDIEKSKDVYNPNVQYKLGSHYYHGKGVEKDLKAAFKWYKRAALQGHQKARSKLAQCYLKGEGVEKDLEKGMNWILKNSESDKKCMSKKIRYNPLLKKSIGNDVSDYNTREKKKGELMKELAELGDINAQYQTGENYLIGLKGMSEDEDKAKVWLKKAAERNHAKAQHKLFLIYSGQESFEWLKKAAESGDPQSQNTLSVFYKNGKVIEKDMEKSMEWLKKSAYNGYESSQLDLANFYEKESDYGKALVWYEGLAHQGDIISQMHLGHLYKDVNEVKDLKKAAFWYLKAAEQGNSQAMSMIANFYANGIGVEKDLEKSVFWYQKMVENPDYRHSPYREEQEFHMEAGLIGADMNAQNDNDNKNMRKSERRVIELHKKVTKENDAKSKYKLATHYIRGKGVEKDLSKALQLVKESAEQGYVRAQERLGELYGTRFGIDPLETLVKQDNKKSYKWHKRASYSGSSHAMTKIAIMYEFGTGVKRNPEKAFAWYIRAAEKGGVYAQMTIADIYAGMSTSFVPSHDYPMNPDDEKALKWYKEATKQGNKNAKRKVARFYAIGLGVKRDYEKAFELYHTMAKDGDAHAQYILGEMYVRGLGVEKDVDKGFEWFRTARSNGMTLHTDIILNDPNGYLEKIDGYYDEYIF